MYSAEKRYWTIREITDPNYYIKKHSGQGYEWYVVSKSFKLRESFIEENAHHVWWPLIFQYQVLSESFLKRYIDKDMWSFIIIFQKLSEEFIERHMERWNNIWSIPWFQDVSQEFIDKHNMCGASLPVK